MKRVLRITASAFFGVVTVALIMLWIHSYHRRDFLSYAGNNLLQTNVATHPGMLVVSAVQLDKLDPFLRNAYRDHKVRLYWTYFSGELDPLDNEGISIQWATVPAGVGLHLPLWFLTTISAGLAVIPWFPFSRRFGLRSLLIATTLVSLLLGLICYSIR